MLLSQSLEFKHRLDLRGRQNIVEDLRVVRAGICQSRAAVIRAHPADEVIALVRSCRPGMPLPDVTDAGVTAVPSALSAFKFPCLLSKTALYVWFSLTDVSVKDASVVTIAPVFDPFHEVVFRSRNSCQGLLRRRTS